MFKSPFVSSSLGLPPLGEGPVAFTAVCTDTRKLVPGCLFVALKGENFDAHEFAAQALESGAGGAVCSRATAPATAEKIRAAAAKTRAAVFWVEDTLAAFRTLGGEWRKSFRIPVVAVAGAVGKTTTKEFLAAMLRGKWPETLQTQGSENGFVGIPMTLLNLREKHQAAVIEIGIDEVGAMEQHLPLVEPQAAIVTAIGPEHLEKLHDLETITREECRALDWVAGHGGFLAVNGDDNRISEHFREWRKGEGKGLPLHHLEYGLGIAPSPAALTGSLKGDLLTIRVPQGDTFPLQLPLPGAHNAKNLLGAAALALGLGLTPAEITAGLKSFKPIFGRSELKTLAPGIEALCDYYNANPTSVEAALDVLQERTGSRADVRRWVCLGDMLELGPQELDFHAGLAPKLRTVLTRGNDELLLYGKRMKALETALRKEFRGRVRHFSTHASLATVLKDEVTAPAFIVIKGSRSMKMEDAWKLFVAAFGK